MENSEGLYEGIYFLVLHKTVFLNLKNSEPLKRLSSKIIFDIIMNQIRLPIRDKKKTKRIMAHVTEDTVNEVLNHFPDEKKKLEYKIIFESCFNVVTEDELKEIKEKYKENSIPDDGLDLIAIGTHYGKQFSSPIIISDDEKFLEEYEKLQFTHKCFSTTTFITEFLPYHACFHPDCGMR